MGKNSNNVVLTVLVIGLLALAGYVIFGKDLSIPTGGTGGGNLGQEGCGVAPAISAIGTDAIVPSTSVTAAGAQYIVNGVYVGSSYTGTNGDSVRLLEDPTYYLAEVKDFVVHCGQNNIVYTWKKFANVTVTMYTDAGTEVLSNSLTAGTVNESLMSNSKNWKMHLVGTAQKTTGDTMMIAEFPSGSASNMSTVTLTCGGSALASVPISSFITSTNTNAYRIAYVLPELKDGAVQDCYLSATLLASKTLSGSMRTSYYGQEQFVDTDSIIKKGLYDSAGTAKFEGGAAQTYNFIINNA